MGRLTEFIGRFALRLGALGLAFVAFLDSSFVPLPGVVDTCLLFMAALHPDRWLLYAGAATAGSMAGCYTLYAIARKGGEAFLRKRVSEKHATKGLETFRRYGLLALIVPAILPPPTPFKIFVLLAGVTSVPRGSFLLATGLGRGFRYGGLALLARLYGADAERLVRGQVSSASIWVAVAVAIGGIAFVLWRRRRAS